jgi:hypothetical protein
LTPGFFSVRNLQCLEQGQGQVRGEGGGPRDPLARRHHQEERHSGGSNLCDDRDEAAGQHDVKLHAG